MPWPGGQSIATVEQYTEGVVRKVLRNNGFELDGAQCVDFQQVVVGVVRYVGEHYTGVIMEAITDVADDHSAPDLVSWCVDEISQIFSYAMQLLQVRLVDSLSLPIGWSRPVRCAEAMTGIDWLEEVCVAAVVQRKAMHAAPIKSARLAKVRRLRRWSPSEVDVLTVVKAYFR